MDVDGSYNKPEDVVGSMQSCLMIKLMWWTFAAIGQGQAIQMLNKQMIYVDYARKGQSGEASGSEVEKLSLTPIFQNSSPQCMENP